MHPAAKQFCDEIALKFPCHFGPESRALDAGSLDINGSNRYLFQGEYTGIDLGEGRNVDRVCRIHEMDGTYTTVISTECFEHDEFLRASITNIAENLLEPGGLFLFTCATTGRREHGTRRTTPGDAPFVPDYYQNVTRDMVEDLVCGFTDYEFRTVGYDLQFWGIK